MISVSTYREDGMNIVELALDEDGDLSRAEAAMMELRTDDDLVFRINEADEGGIVFTVLGLWLKRTDSMKVQAPYFISETIEMLNPDKRILRISKE